MFEMPEKRRPKILSGVRGFWIFLANAAFAGVDFRVCGALCGEQLEEVIRGGYGGYGEDKERVEELCWSSVEEDAVEEDLGDRVSSREGVGVRRL